MAELSPPLPPPPPIEWTMTPMLPSPAVLTVEPSLMVAVAWPPLPPEPPEPPVEKAPEKVIFAPGSSEPLGIAIAYDAAEPAPPLPPPPPTDWATMPWESTAGRFTVVTWPFLVICRFWPLLPVEMLESWTVTVAVPPLPPLLAVPPTATAISRIGPADVE
ncbi:hypothetical protein D9M68_457200 [compost metagenome]